MQDEFESQPDMMDERVAAAFKPADSEQSGSELADIERIAMRSLARREYSRLELTRKLLVRKAFKPEQVAAVLNKLERSNYLSDERYADLIVRSRINACCGPFKIKIELRDKGIADQLVEKIMADYDVDWIALAKAAKEKRFGVAEPDDVKALAKQMRYLQNKGFYQHHISSVFTAAEVF